MFRYQQRDIPYPTLRGLGLESRAVVSDFADLRSFRGAAFRFPPNLRELPRHHFIHVHPLSTRLYPAELPQTILDLSLQQQ